MPPCPNPGPRLRFLVLSPLSLALGFGPLYIPSFDALVIRITGSLVEISAALIHLFHLQALVSGSVLTQIRGKVRH